MRKATLLVMVMVGAWAWVASAAAAESLLAQVPDRPLIAVHAKDLGRLVDKLKTLPAAQTYLKSKARDAYADSKLALKLAARAKNLSTLAGMDLTFETLVKHARSETVLALYDIGELEFLILARMSPAAQAELSFVKKRADFTERVYAGHTYRAKIDYDAGFSFVFYQEGDLLLVSSVPELIEGALLARDADAKQPRLVDEADWRAIVKQDEFGGADARLFVDLKRLVKDRYFRNYWVWRNWRAFEGTRAAGAGFWCESDAVTERRVLLGPTMDAPKTRIRCTGAGMQEYAAGGERTSVDLAAHFGWSEVDLDWDQQTRSRLLIVEPYADPNTGLTDVHRAAVVECDVSPAAALSAVAEQVRKEHPALVARLQVRETPTGAVLDVVPGLAGLAAQRLGPHLVLANDAAYLEEVTGKLRTKENRHIRVSRVDKAAARQLVTFLTQADQLRVVYGAEFLTEILPDLLRAAAEFSEFTTETTPFAGGLMQETHWR